MKREQLKGASLIEPKKPSRRWMVAMVEKQTGLRILMRKIISRATALCFLKRFVSGMWPLSFRCFSPSSQDLNLTGSSFAVRYMCARSIKGLTSGRTPCPLHCSPCFRDARFLPTPPKSKPGDAILRDQELEGRGRMGVVCYVSDQ